VDEDLVEREKKRNEEKGGGTSVKDMMLAALEKEASSGGNTPEERRMICMKANPFGRNRIFGSLSEGKGNIKQGKSRRH